jgi:hypothetical protein
MQSRKRGDTIGINRFAVDTVPKIETPFRGLAVVPQIALRGERPVSEQPLS